MNPNIISGRFPGSLWPILLGTAALTVLQSAFDLFLDVPGEPGSMGWQILSHLLTVLVLALCAIRSRSYGLPLTGSVFLLYFGVFHFNNLIEAAFFSIGVPREEIAKLLLNGFLVGFIFSPLLVLILKRMRRPGTPDTSSRSPRRPVSWIWRIAVCDISYLVLYIVAGALVYPHIRDFYAGTELPEPASIFLMQLFRALVFIAASWPLIRTMSNRRTAALCMGSAFSILGGIAPLLVPNPYMPGAVRAFHAIEIGISNFIYGWIVGYMLFPGPSIATTSSTTTPAGQDPL